MMKTLFFLFFLILIISGTNGSNGKPDTKQNDTDIHDKVHNNSSKLVLTKDKEKYSFVKNDENKSDESMKKLIEELQARVTQLEDKLKEAPKRTCQELFQSGTKISGSYVIDPDGSERGYPSIIVECLFEDNLGITIFTHNTTNMTMVTQCSNPGCSIHNISYFGASKQIQNVIFQSTHCEQSIEYQCNNAPLFECGNGGITYGYWKDRHGDDQVYFTGANNAKHVCQCFIDDGKCQGPEYMNNTCNCDAGIPDWRKDSGTITNMTALPIQSLHFGGLTHESKKAKFVVGKLKCWGDRASNFGEKPPSSCQEAKLRGSFRSGFYQIIKNNSTTPVLVHCNMLASEYDNVVETVYSDTLAKLNVILLTQDVRNGPKINMIKEMINFKIVNNDSIVVLTKGFYAIKFGHSNNDFEVQLLVNGTLKHSLNRNNDNFKIFLLELDEHNLITFSYYNVGSYYYGRNRLDRVSFTAKLV